MPLYQCDKAVLRLTHGADSFLKAYSTNTLDRTKNAFVDVRGRIVAVFDQYRLAGDELFLVVEKNAVRPLFKHLEKYLDLTGVLLEELRHFVYFDLQGDEEPISGDVCLPQPKGKLLLTAELRKATVSENNFTRFRLEHFLPLQGKDYGEEMLLNVFDDEYVSYTKGCYLGQEIIARVHHRSRPPKKLVVKYESECRQGQAEQMTSKLWDASRGENRGFVFEE